MGEFGSALAQFGKAVAGALERQQKQFDAARTREQKRGGFWPASRCE
jgi:hypothetical protein